MNKHKWNWFYNTINKEANCFYGVELKFIYCGVIITSTIGDNRAEFCSDDFDILLRDVMIYLNSNFKRRKYIIKIKK